MRYLTLAHRWMGVVLCLFFAAWFLSGAVLIYHPFPSLSQADRLSSRAEVDFSKITVSPIEAAEAIGSIDLDRLRLIDLEGRPIYVLHSLNSGIKVVDAHDGKPINLLQMRSAGRIAENFSGKSALRVEGPIDYDQWIVPNRYDPYRPFYRVSMQDQNETVLYVSMRTGEVLQKTEARERAWNYIGAIVHWIYPTVLRSNWVLWDQVVWWISLMGVMTTLAGLLLGIIRFRGASGRSPFKGWLCMHHILGLFAGIIVLTWIFSGWLSMDHGRLFSKPDPEFHQIKNFRALSLEQAVESVSLEALKLLENFSEVEFIATGGKSFVLARNSKGLKMFKPSKTSILSPARHTEPEIIKAVQKAWPDVGIKATQWPKESDFYGQLREGSLPSNTLRVKLDDPAQTWIHVDMDSGQIVSIMDKSRRVYRWFYNGLHSLDFPGLANHRPLWDIVILSLLAIGFGFSVTGVVLGWKRLFNC